MEKIILALDWTPNTNHSGFFVAASKGFYQEEGLEVILRSPEEDQYQSTPAKLVAEGKAHLAIAPSESIIAYQSQLDRPSLMAIAAILQEDVSAIVALSSSDIHSMKDLDGKRYASYDARFEDLIVSEMIKKDGGKGQHIKITPEKLGIWDTLLNGQAEATWVFMPWEGIMARRKNVGLKTFFLKDYQIPYGYSPVILGAETFLNSQKATIKKFLKATRKGFESAIANPAEAIQILSQSGTQPELQDLDFLLQSQEFIHPFYKNEQAEWGEMNSSRWDGFVQWLHEQHMLSKEELVEIKSKKLYTNEFLT
jgi:ABC-type nitrate/sulfonate/bicarbonate transport system substrate-binding protein